MPKRKKAKLARGKTARKPGARAAKSTAGKKSARNKTAGKLPAKGTGTAAGVIRVKALARVEGEGGLYLRIRKGKVTTARLDIFEPPRFFESLLRGRRFTEAPDITARICGICPIAYMMGASRAMENAFGQTDLGARIRKLRRLAYCGEWIESHVLHVYMLHLPDFLGYESAIHLAKDMPKAVAAGLDLKKAGNDILETVGGRAIHPVNLRVGGFYSFPQKSALDALHDRLMKVLPIAEETVKLTAKLNFPDIERDYDCVSMRHPDEYAIVEGKIVSSTGLDIPISEFEQNFREEHAKHSNALRGRRIHPPAPIGKPGPWHGAYLVGPIARYNNNAEQLGDDVLKHAHKAGLGKIVKNPFKSIVVRAVETLYAVRESIRLIESLGSIEPGEKSFIEIDPAKGSAQNTGYGCTEAPRGFCWHKYTVGNDGLITEARIVPPTSQNQLMVESDLAEVAEKNARLPHAKLQWRLEQTIRNYDPCISCATHFLKLDLDR